MANKRFGIEFEGFNDLVKKFEQLEGDIKSIAEDCLEVIPDMINPELHQEMSKHRKTGNTEKSIVENPKVEWSGSKATISVGFDLKKGGMPSVFLMYGTARHAPKNQYGAAKSADAKANPGMAADKKLYNAIYGAAINKKINEKQKEIFLNAIKNIMGE